MRRRLSRRPRRGQARTAATGRPTAAAGRAWASGPAHPTLWCVPIPGRGKAASMAAPSSDYERRLIENIQPIRYFFLAEVLHHAFQRGVFASLADGPGASAAALAQRLGLEETRLRAVLA